MAKTKNTVAAKADAKPTVAKKAPKAVAAPKAEPANKQVPVVKKKAAAPAVEAPKKQVPVKKAAAPAVEAPKKPAVTKAAPVAPPAAATKKSAPIAKKAPDAPAAKKPVEAAGNGSNGHSAPVRLNVQKTYKIYIGGAFPRTESGRFIGFKNAAGELVANYCRGSRKDFRNAVVAARKAFEGWAHRAHFNRGQILYRIAEMLEGRKAQFIAELVEQGASLHAAEAEVTAAIDRMVYYAGWCDKYQQIFSSVNAVSSSHFDFSMLEPMGVISVFAPASTGLLGLVSVVAPLIAGGNTVVVLASEQFPLSAVTFAEVLHSSDVPSGVVNVLTGLQSELKEHFSTHMDVNAMVYAGNNAELIATLQKNATHNVKRILVNKTEDWYADAAQSPYLISEAQEVKTTWHPVGM